MRNTIVKLLMAIAMCFVIGTALVACAGADGKDGTNGKDGKDGKDGTVVTVSDDGYLVLDGVKTDFKIKGENGKDGVDGTNGTDGAPGLSAYQIWLQLPGNEGKSEEDFFASLKGEDGEDLVNNCDHGDANVDDTKFSFFSLVDHERIVDAETGAVTFKDGKGLFICNDCGYAQLLDCVHHEYVDASYEQSCVSGEYTGKECYCGHRTGEETKPRLPHTYEKLEGEAIVLNKDAFKPVLGTEFDLCVDGGFVAAYCENCSATDCFFDTPDADEKGHHLDSAEVVVAPTDVATGKAAGECKHCEETIEFVLPKKGDAAYTIGYGKDDVDKPNCEEPGKEHYLYTYVKDNLLLDADVTVDVYTVDVDKAGHKLGYIVVDEEGNKSVVGVKDFREYAKDIDVASGLYIFDRYIKIDNKFYELNVYTAVNTPAFECEKNGVAAMFKCEVCAEDEDTHGMVSVLVDCNHAGVANALPCNEYTAVTYEPCFGCGEKVELNKELGKHEYTKFEVKVGNEVMVDGKMKLELTIISMCEATHNYTVIENGVPVNRTQKCYEQYDENTYASLSDEEKAVIGYKTEDVYGEYVGRTFDGCLGGNTYKYTDKLGVEQEKTIWDDEADHTIMIDKDGKRVLESEFRAALAAAGRTKVDSLGKVAIFDSDFDGIKKFMNVQYTTCMNEYDFYYFCPNCPTDDNVVQIKGILDHTVDMDNPVSEVAPTCETAGSKTYACTNCTASDVTVPVPALGHVFDKYVVVDKADVADDFKAPTFTEAGYMTVEACCVRKGADGNYTCVGADTKPLVISKYYDLPKFEGNIYNAETNPNGVYVKVEGDKSQSCTSAGEASYIFTINTTVDFKAAKVDGEDAKFEVEFEGAASAGALGHTGYIPGVTKVYKVKAYHSEGLLEDEAGKYDYVRFYVCERCDVYVAVPMV